jgi:hypothetical protein
MVGEQAIVLGIPDPEHLTAMGGITRRIVSVEIALLITEMTRAI